MAWFRPQSSRAVFPLTDDDSIGSLTLDGADDQFDDVLMNRSAAQIHTDSYLGNFATRHIWRNGILLMTMVFGVLILRVGYWDIVHGATYRQIADENRTRTRVILPNRGVIKDRNGVVLAWNTPAFHLLARCADIPNDSAARAQRFQELADTFHVDGSDFEDRYARARSDETVLLAENVPYDNAIAYMATHGDDRSVFVELASNRSYITNAIPSLSHVLGFTGAIASEDYEVLKYDGYRRFDAIGKQGIEQEYEKALRGTLGKEIVEVNAQGKPTRILEELSPVNGTDVTVSIDAGLTAAIEESLAKRLVNAQVKRAAVVVTNPKNGEVLALVSYPSFDANLFARGITQEAYEALLNDPNAPLFPRATQGEYPSGSTIKPVYAAAALMEHVITPTTSFLSTGGLWLGTRFFPDWRAGGHGVTNVYHAIADSVNTFFYMIGGGNETFEGLGLERLMKYAALFGFGSRSGIDLPNEATGFLPTKAWKEETKGEPWYVGDTYNVSIGQGDFLATPLQINRSTATFANGGTLYVPHLVKDAGSVGTKIVPDDVDTVVRDAMRQTVTNGSATSLQDLAKPVAGKTGTAQWATGRAPHTWFTGFGPFDDPEIAVTVIVEEGGNAYYATPISHDIFAWWFANRSSP